jgi:hypothetical protein
VQSIKINSSNRSPNFTFLTTLIKPTKKKAQRSKLQQLFFRLSQEKLPNHMKIDFHLEIRWKYELGGVFWVSK